MPAEDRWVRYTMRDILQMQKLIERFERDDFDDYRQGLIEFYEYRNMLIERMRT